MSSGRNYFNEFLESVKGLDVTQLRDVIFYFAWFWVRHDTLLCGDATSHFTLQLMTHLETLHYCVQIHAHSCGGGTARSECWCILGIRGYEAGCGSGRPEAPM